MPSRIFQYLSGAALGALTALTLTACQQDQPTSPSNGSGTDGEAIIDFELTPAGAAAAKASMMVGTHGLPTIPLREQTLSRINASVGWVDNSPFDLSYSGGPVVKAATHYVIYVNCVAPETPGTCWGNGPLAPANFLRDLNASEYLRLVNEYIGADARLKFPVAASMRTTATFATPKRATLQEIQHIVSDAITAAGGATGYAGMYHVFLPKGTEVCIVAGNCYSPSDPASWAFCAFHGSVNFGPTQHVLFTVQPYQGVDGCQWPGQTPQGLIDATGSTLAHEVLETITDPDFDAWSNGLFGFEISDMCSTFSSNLLLNTRQYFLQSQYSNTKHMCTTQAPA
ncbi:MAG TPA: hypothetical protein VMS62_02925 [Gemmatimonadales bacterium]|nr:hypothetical protein [Gemmatimonadales bacterium]